MAWEFQTRAINELFAISTSSPGPNEHHRFDTDRWDDYDPANNLVKRHNAMMLLRGSTSVHIQNAEKVITDFDKYEWDETGRLGNTNPYGYDRLIYPKGVHADFVSGPEGVDWLCFFPHQEGVRVMYEVYRGTHKFYSVTNTDTYGTVVKGDGCVAGRGDMNIWEPYLISAGDVNYVECADEESITFYVWEEV